jgi:hypothetical protein
MTPWYSETTRQFNDATAAAQKMPPRVLDRDFREFPQLAGSIRFEK